MSALPPCWFLFAPGAGASSTSPWMKRWQELLGRLGPVVPFDYPYMLAGRRRPDPLPRLVEAHRQALEAARGTHPGAAVLVGKSMGGRVGCHLSLVEPVAAAVCLGYPLRSPSASKSKASAASLRDQVLLEMRTPVLFVQGTRDPLCPLDVLEEVRQRMSAPHDLHVVEDGDHSLTVTKTRLNARGTTQARLEEEALEHIAAFLTRTLS